MKDKLKGLMVGLTIGSLVAGSTVFAGTNMKLNVVLENVKYMFNGVEKQSSQSIIYNGQLYVSASSFAKNSGQDFTYDGKNKTAWVGKKEGTFKYLSDISYARTDKAAAAFHLNKWINVGDPTKAYSGEFRIADNKYLHGIGLENLFFMSNKGSGSIEYNLNGKYKKLTGFVGIDDHSKDSENPGTVKFIADGKEIYYSSEMLGGDLPKEVNLDISGVLKLRIEFTTTGEDYRSSTMIDFVEAKLFQ
ncbi:NPCBM/NEW2 domain-containing protein [Paenibacillus sp. FSL R7-0179]|uniref:NPCBM/NEW2 domain-containing protein n=1 Tax=Paenibacillus sp. FSL R7-0179 TaxID=2921672 RepID=UPI0030F975BF